MVAFLDRLVLPLTSEARPSPTTRAVCWRSGFPCAPLLRMGCQPRPPITRGVTMSVSTPTVQPAVWLACLHCCNEGRLAGIWFACDTIDEVTLAEVYGRAENVRSGCEEVLALDSEYLPHGVGKVTQTEGAAWGELFAEIGEDRWSELLVWYENCSPSLDVRGVPFAADFDEGNQGCWESFRAFVESWLNLYAMRHPKTVVPCVRGVLG